MNTCFVNDLYNNFEVFEVNKMAGRSYYIPFRSVEKMQETTYLTERYDSDMITLLNGTWDVLYFEDCREIPQEFDPAKYRLKFSKAQVPGCWQFQGFEPPYYVNQRYQFKPNPPKVPKDTPAMIYHRTFDLEKVAANEVITFLGVAAALELYINGEFVGYSEGSHNSAEFNISKYLVAGENEIICIVYKWCNGTYLECQDMFRNNGIFRDVYLTHYGESFIRDFSVKPKYLSKGRYELYMGADVVGNGLYSIIYTLRKGNSIIHTMTMNSGEEIRYILDDVHEWTAETPYLYSLQIELVDNHGLAMCLTRDFGVKNVAINGNTFMFNDVAIKMRGVNHHDNSEVSGFYMTVDEYKKDIETMKEHNVNAIRMSHYPPDPIFILMCEHYGMYVIDEADIETHGVLCGGEYYHPKCISHNKKWKEHFWDRVSRMYERDKNSVAVTMWSLGNESHGYKCQDYCYAKLKSLTDIPIHYEAVIHTKRFAYDVISEMYVEPSKMQKYLTGKLGKKYYKKPYFLCEYAHAMGVGPGDLETYWDLIYKNYSLMGGCIWEWRDHSVKHTEENAKYLYTYGGDHGEEKHDFNFCVDGLTYPDCTPHTGALCMKNVYSPVRTQKVNDQFVIFNRQDFLDTQDIEIKWSIWDSGILQKQGVFEKNILPKNQEVFEPEVEIKSDSDICLIMTYTSKAHNRVLGEDCIILKTTMPAVALSAPCKMLNSGENLRVSFEGGSLSLNLKTGMLASYKIDGKQLLNIKPLRPDGLPGFVGSVYRAPIDNYRNINNNWVKQGLDKLTIELKNINYKEEYGEINTLHSLKVGNKEIMKYRTHYVIGQKGDIKIESILFATKQEVDLPKFGYSVEMAEEFKNLVYYGLGDVENYSDFKNQAKLGIFETTSDKMLQPYIKPQDSGNRSEVRWAKVTNDNGVGLEFVAVNKPFNFNVITTTLDNLQKAGHLEDVKVMSLNNVSIDGFMRGIGSNSCGPDTAKENKYILKADNPLEFSFIVKPIRAEKE